MSFDIFVQRFENGDAAPADIDVIQAALGPFMDESTRTDAFVRLAFEDGETDLYGHNDFAAGFMVNHAEGAQVWDALVELAARAGLTIIAGGEVFVTSAEAITHLPDGLEDSVEAVVIVNSGEDILRHWRDGYVSKGRDPGF